MLLLFTALISTAIRSAKISAGRAAAASAAEAAVFSLFSCYDTEIFRDWHLLVLNGGNDPGVYPAFLKEAADPVLHPDPLTGQNVLQLSLEECFLEGIRSAACSGGAAAAGQAILYMRSTIGISAVRELLPGTQESQIAEEAEGRARLSEDPNQELAKLKAAAEKEKAAASKDGTETAENGTPSVPDDFVNPLETASQLRASGLLGLVLPAGKTVSAEPFLGADAPSRRELQDGAGIIDAPDLSGPGSRLLLGEYILRHAGHFLVPSGRTPVCGAEYILAGRDSDAKNLTYVLEKLLLLRTGANALHILKDASLRTEADKTAQLIAASVGAPELGPLVTGLFISAWAFAESILDLRALMSGKRVPAIKRKGDWQLPAESFPLLLTDPDALIKDCPSGSSYNGWLRFLLSSADPKKSAPRLLDLIENSVRQNGRPSFRIDSCADSLSCVFRFRAENAEPFEVRRTYSYLPS